MKGVAPYAIFIVVLIGILLFFTMAIFFKWIDFSKTGANQIVCNSKLFNYCTEWWKGGFGSTPYDWSGKAPTSGCEQFIRVSDGNGPSITECKALIGVK